MDTIAKLNKLMKQLSDKNLNKEAAVIARAIKAACPKCDGDGVVYLGGPQLTDSGKAAGGKIQTGVVDGGTRSCQECHRPTGDSEEGYASNWSANKTFISPKHFLCTRCADDKGLIKSYDECGECHGSGEASTMEKQAGFSQEQPDLLREELSDLAHAQWSGWMKYLFGKSKRNADGSVTIPKELVERWDRQVATGYADLSEDEKNSDRKEADRALALLKKFQQF